ncbi:cadherin-99C-like isoform X1 [Haliotis rufescens]|uniref:cadherin-99C-like isoform X1 n=1 Tax=Haliotis rufescens TaxID=6454 RepID=UPI00201E777F|nr:cadherin-99C-like isoform X1 [Haliotis rufescens]XP_048248668.1 cadherin-99C-like isoform X1 [Haliotis rufescens]
MVSLWVYGVFLLACAEIVTAQVTFFTSCQDASAVGTMSVAVPEADSQLLIDGSPSTYKVSIGIDATQDSIGLSFDSNVENKVPPLEYFQLVSGNSSSGSSGQEWYLQLIKAINRDGIRPDSLDDITVMEYTMKCTDLPINMTFFILLRVQILDVNDNSPLFVSAPYEISLTEIMPVGSTVFRGITATDLDFDFNKNIVFDIVPGDQSLFDGSTKFSIDIPPLGYVTLKSKLDFESNTQYSLQIRARDGAPAPSTRSSTTILNITITDADDLPPVFEYSTCVADGDGKCFNPSYDVALTSGSIGALSIYPRPLNNPPTPVNIQARDQDSLNFNITFTVEQTDPVGYENFFQVSTEPVPGTSSFRAQLQQIQPINRSGAKTLAVILRAEEVSSNRYHSRATVFVTVLPSSAPLEITSSTVSLTGYIREDAYKGGVVMDQNMVDLFKLIVRSNVPTNSTPKYTFEVDTNGFSVDSNNILRLNTAVLDYETVKQYTLSIRARPAGTSQSFVDVNVTVNVVDVNDNSPEFSATFYDVSQIEGDYSGNQKVALIQLTATDVDTVGSVRYSISTASTGAANKASIDAANGTLYLQARVSGGDQYILHIRASDSDSGPRRDTAVVRITITSSDNKGPRIPAELFTVTYSECISINRSIFTVPATDPEGGRLNFAIIGGNNGNTFSIDRDGTITNLLPLDFEMVNVYSLLVEVSDAASVTATTTVRVVVADVNDNSPAFNGTTDGIYTFTVMELKTSAVIGNVMATDVDEPNTDRSRVVYSLMGTSSMFEIDAQSGQISCGFPDPAHQPIHELTVIATDSASDARMSAVTVVVNVSVPIFGVKNYEVVVLENAQDVPVVNVTADNRDQSASASYKFTAGDYQSFSINPQTGEIRTAVPLDYESRHEYVLEVSTYYGTLSSLPSSTATVSVAVADVNDESPVISVSGGPINVYVMGNAAVGTRILDINAVDGDPANTPNSNVKFYIASVTPSNGTGLFEVNQSTGEVTVATLLGDATQSTNYTLQVVASDEGTPPRTDDILVTVYIGSASASCSTCSTQETNGQAHATRTTVGTLLFLTSLAIVCNPMVVF